MEALQFIENLDRFESSSDSEEETERRPRVIKNRPNYFETLDDVDFFRRFRMSKPTVLYVLEQIENDLEFITDKNNSLSPINQLLQTLRFYATGSFLLELGDFGGVSASTSCRVIRRVTTALGRLKDRYIKFPATDEEMATTKLKFFEVARFPNVLGTLDCTHIKIENPGGDDAELFRNRKGYFSINVQTVSSPDLKINNIVCRWPGSTHDSVIFQNSRLCFNFERGIYGNGILLGDSGYPLKNYLLTPYLNPRNVAQVRYNHSHIRTRNIVERQYGVLKRRFPVLSVGLRLKLERATNVIIACAILHNICIEAKEDQPPDDMENIGQLIEAGQINQPLDDQNLYGNARDVIVQNFFQ